MAHSTLSTSVDERIAARLRGLAKREDRSASSLIASALSLYTLMPSEMREALRVLAAEDEAFLREVLNEMAAHAVRRKFDFGRRALSTSTKSVAEMEVATEADLAELALQIAHKS